MKILRAIGRRWVTTRELLKAVYGRVPPVNAQNTLNATISLLLRKMEFNHDPILIERIKGNGTRMMKMRRRTRRKS